MLLVKKRKGIVHLEAYKHNIIRNARTHGLGYVNYSEKSHFSSYFARNSVQMHPKILFKSH